MEAFQNILHVSYLRKILPDLDIIVSEIPTESGKNFTLEKISVRIIDRK